jgi:uncharacterized protein YjbI with pentapeptide repeats
MEFLENEYCDKIFKDLNLKQISLKSKEFDNCTFINCKLNETILQCCRFTECTFDNCDLSLLKIKDTIFNDVTIKDCKAIGIDWSSSQEPFDINFNNSNISMSSFYKLNLKHSSIIACLAHEVDFSETNLEKANFKNTDLLNSTFDNTKLQYTDLSMAKNYLINPELNYLKKTKVSENEASSFLQFLNLDIVR